MKTIPHMSMYLTFAGVGFAASAVLLGLKLWGTAADNDKAVPARLAARGERVPLLINCRERPIQISPLRNMANVVSEDDLVVLLCAALPWWNPPSVPSVYHELKLWGPYAAFTKDMLGIERKGERLVEMLLSDKACRAYTVATGGHYLLDSPFGIRPVLLGTDDAIETRGEAHYGQLLQVAGEAGLPSTTSVTTASGRMGNLKEIYQDEIMRFSLHQELDFIACTLAYWHPPQKAWKNQFGNESNFDELVSKLLATPLGKGSCGGCHLPYAVVTILRVDELYPLLSANVRQQALTWLRHLCQLLEYRWSDRGGWDRTWSKNDEPSFVTGNDNLDLITITGHHLEWMALAPKEVQPSETTVKRAVAALRRDVESLPPLTQQSFKTLLVVSHAARAVALWRGDNPFSVWMKYWKNRWLKRNQRGFVIVRKSSMK
jgi:hypothetical protein